MAYIFNDDKSKGIIKTKNFASTNVAGESIFSHTFTLEDLGVNYLDDVVILEVRQAASNVDSTRRSRWASGGHYVKNNNTYPLCTLLYGYGITIEAYNPANTVQRIDVELTYMITDVEHAE